MVQTTRHAAIYCRVSTDDQDCERQERDLRAFAKRAGYSIGNVYKETASGTKNDRAIRKRVLDAAQERRIDAVLVTELSRWGRNTEDLLHTLQQLADWKVSLVAMNGMDCDLTTASGKLMLTVLAGVAEFERNLLSERTKSGIALARSRGKKIGRQPGQTIRPNPHTQAVLKLAQAGVPYRTIATDLQLSKTTVQSIINRNR
jgi:putative DNA-invertase from lambdoid prophage Rac